MKWTDKFISVSNGERLALSVHEVESPRATVVMFPGFTSKRLNATNTNLARSLSEQSIRCIAVDLSGHGDSSGLIEEQTVSKAAQEIADVLDHLRSGKMTPESGSIGLVANSFSANAAIVAVGRHGMVDAVALKSPVTEYVAMRLKLLGPRALRKWQREGRIVLPDGTPSNYEFIADAERLDTYAELRRITVPVLALQGSKDEEIPKRSRHRLRKEMTTLGMSYVEVRGGDHNLSDPHFMPSIRRMKDFLVETLE